MKLKKGILLITILFLSMLVLSPLAKVQAAEGSLYLDIKMLRNSGYGYQLADGTKNVWKIYEVGKTADDTIYCLKGGPGFGSSNFSGSYVAGTETKTLYTRYFDLKDPASIPDSYKVALPDVNSINYKALIWILDNCYVLPKQGASDEAKAIAAQNRQMLLEAAKNYALDSGNPDIEAYHFDYLTDDDIDAVQQLAVWHYTNQAGDGYHIDNTFTFWLNAVAGTDGNYMALTNTPRFGDEGWYRMYACQALFEYLTKTPKQAGFDYDITSTVIQKPTLVNTELTAKTVNGRTVIGPYQIQGSNSDNYSLQGIVKDAKGNNITDFTYVDQNGNPIQNVTTLKDLIGKNFYISIPTNSNSSTVTFEISGSYFTTTTTYWSVESPNPAKDQPVVKVEKKNVPFNDSKVYKEFDLSLRKFIISIDGEAPKVDRTPQISNTEITNLANGTTTTANKVHTKTALPVKTGSKVIYKIRVYNEGAISGYATQITDYLPSGLTFLPNSTINKTYGWSNPSGDGKTIVTNYLADKELDAFNGSNIDFEDLQIECEVTAVVQDKDISLKNIAEITAHKDENGKTTVIDRDSQPGNVNLNNYKEVSQQDDDDFEQLILIGKSFDLSLRKFITTVQNGTDTKIYNRAPQVVTTELASGASTTATYNHPKTPIGVSNGNIVTYTIRVYNEGELDGYVTEITDHLPEQLEFIVDDETNIKYGWTVSTDGRTVKTTITSPKTTYSANRDEIYKNRVTDENKVLLKAFDGTNLDYIDVQIKCKVKENINLYQKITNIADITGFTDSNGNPIKDRDSQENNVKLPTDEELPSYKDEFIDRGDNYIEGQQDDDDFEKLVLQIFDLSLRKFITGVNDKEITSRAPVFNKNGTQYTYEHTKEPVEVANGNTVIYTLRIFNEGNVAGYAQEIKDNLPEGLIFLPEHEINVANRWKMYKEDGTETTKVEEAVSIRTDYLSKEQEKEENANLIQAFNPETMTMPDYKDIKVAFKVTEPNTSDRIIINTAEISEDADKEGKPVDDIDSTPDNNIEGEDDIDIEKIKVKYFDLSLKKWVTESIVTYNGKTTVTKTGHTGDENPEAPAKVELKANQLSKTTVKFKFNIKVTNEGEIAGYATELIDYIPEGLKYDQKDNPKWREENGKVLTNQLKDKLLQPGESATVEIILTWVNNKNNLSLKTNWAEIYKDKNEYNSPDIDSTPGNNVKGEDDIDQAPVILTIATGIAPTYVILTLASVTIIAAGVVLIKKFVI